MPRRDPYTWLKRLDAAHLVTRHVPALTGLVRAISGAAYRLLEVLLGPRHPHTRVERQASALAGTRTPGGSDLDGPRVLFLTLRGWFAHVTTEGLIGEALRLRGARPTFALCGGVLEQCDFKPPSDPHVTPALCARCTGFGRRFLEGLEHPLLTMADVIDVAEERARASARVAGLGRDELLAFEHDGMPLGRWVLPSVQRSLLTGRIPDDPRSIDTLRGYVASALVSDALATALLDRIQPDIVVMTNGLFFAERVALERARSRGIRVVTYERGIPANSIIVDVDRPVVPFDVDPYWEAGRGRPLETEQRDRVQALLDDRMSGNVGVQDIWPTMEADGRAILERLGLRPDVSTSVMFTNILWDTAVFGMDVAFDGMFDWVEETIRAFAELPDQQLVIRVHPAEVRLEMQRSRERVADRIREAFPTLPANVAVVEPDDPASSYALLGVADRVLTYSSTIGVEAALLGHTVVVAGETHYRERGFTVDVTDRAGYVDLLADPGTRGPIGEDAAELAWRYGHTFFFGFMRPFPWLDDRSRSRRDLRVTGVDELAPGADPMLDELCDLILGQADLPLASGW